MALYGTNTGCREQEIVQLRWQWEWDVPELQTSLFVVPGEYTKNGEEKVVVLNRVARAIVEAQRGKHPERVFTYAKHERERTPDGKRIKKGKIVRTYYEPTTRMYNTAWKTARRKAAEGYEKRFERTCPDLFRRIRVQDLRHTFGRRLRAASVSFEDRQDLLGHKSGRITSHYSAAEVGSLIEAAEKISAPLSRKSPAVLLVRSASAQRAASK
jgi:integrase